MAIRAEELTEAPLLATAVSHGIDPIAWGRSPHMDRPRLVRPLHRPRLRPASCQAVLSGPCSSLDFELRAVHDLTVHACGALAFGASMVLVAVRFGKRPRSRRRKTALLASPVVLPRRALDRGASAHSATLPFGGHASDTALAAFDADPVPPRTARPIRTGPATRFSETPLKVKAPESRSTFPVRDV